MPTRARATPLTTAYANPATGGATSRAPATRAAPHLTDEVRVAARTPARH
ncbi:hypothetical protein [Nonomuraea sp. NPDC005650]